MIYTRSRGLRTLTRVGIVAAAVGLSTVTASIAFAATGDAAGGDARQPIVETSSEAPGPVPSAEVSAKPSPSVEKSEAVGGPSHGPIDVPQPIGNNQNGVPENVGQPQGFAQVKPEANDNIQKVKSGSKQGKGEELPKTGTDTMAIAGVGGLLTLGGGILVLVGLRRKRAEA